MRFAKIAASISIDATTFFIFPLPIGRLTQRNARALYCLQTYAVPSPRSTHP
jgi:hypothetical protein